jgi:hypothetical protein
VPGVLKHHVPRIVNARVVNMPYKSEQQRKFMYAKHPKIASQWSKKTPKGKLPKRKKKK